MVDKYLGHWSYELDDRFLLLWLVVHVEELMAQVDDLKAQLDNVQAGITATSTRITDLLAQIAAGNTQPDLQPLIDEAASEATQLQTLGTETPSPTPNSVAAIGESSGNTPATSSPAPVGELVKGGEDVTVTPSTGVVVPTP